MRLSRREFLKGALGAAFGLRAAGAGLVKRPNIIMIMIDDMGWMDLRCQGNTRLDTPNIDRLAAEGMRFTDAYSAAPVCSPTRAAVMTGLAPARLKITNHIPDRESFAPKDAKLKSAPMVDWLEPGYLTIAERLTEAGYATGFFGKWHLSGRAGREGLGIAEYEPQYQGFDVNVGGCAYGGPPTYFDPYRIHNIAPRKAGEYLPDRLADEAMEFIAGAGQRPFFVAMWNYAVHWPMEAPAERLAKYERRLGPGLKDARYGAMIEALDAAIGRLMARLQHLGAAENTVVVFTSDNGGFAGVSDCRPLRESKGYLYEGGIRVPMIVRWPGMVEAGAVCAEPVVSMDMYPTFLEIAGLEVGAGDAVDGQSIVGLLKGEKSAERTVCFHYPNYAWHGGNRLGAAIRQGDFKLLEWYDDGSMELYNLRQDIGERRNLAAEMPDKARLMRAKLDKWLAETGAEMPGRVDGATG